MIEQISHMELIFLFADDLMKVFIKILKETNSPIVIISIGVLSTIIALIKESKDKTLFETKSELPKNEISYEELIKENKNLIGAGRTKDVINNLLRYDHPKEKERITNEVLIISSRYIQEASNRRKGTGENNIELNRINNSLLEILDSLESGEVC